MDTGSLQLFGSPILPAINQSKLKLFRNDRTSVVLKSITFRRIPQWIETIEGIAIVQFQSGHFDDPLDEVFTEKYSSHIHRDRGISDMYGDHKGSIFKLSHPQSDGKDVVVESMSITMVEMVAGSNIRPPEAGEILAEAFDKYILALRQKGVEIY